MPQEKHPLGYGWRDKDGVTQKRVKENLDTGYGSRPLAEFVADLAKASAPLEDATIEVDIESYEPVAVVGWRKATGDEIEAREKQMAGQDQEARENAKRMLEQVRRNFPDLLGPHG